MAFDIKRYKEYNSLLQTLVNLHKNGSKLRIGDIKSETNMSLDAIFILAKEIQEDNPLIISVTGQRPQNATIKPTYETEPFLGNGGYTTRYDKNIEKEAKTEYKEDIALDKMKIEVDILRRTLRHYGYTQFVAWIGCITALVLVLLKLKEIYYK